MVKRKKVMLTQDMLSLDALMEDDEAPFAEESGGGRDIVEEEVFRSLCIKEIYASLALLSQSQRDVLSLIFGLDGQDKLSLQEVAWRFGENTFWVLRTARGALNSLRSVCGARLEGYLEIAA